MAAPVAVHPMLPRVGQAITGVIAVESLAFGTWGAVVVALALAALEVPGPRWSPVARLFRPLARTPATLVPAMPARFAAGVAAAGLAVAVALWAAGAPTAGWVLVGVVGVVSLVAAVTGACAACAAWRRVVARRLGRDLRGPLGLSGPGPWLVLVTAPGCTTCAPAARELAAAAPGGAVVQVDLAARAQARALPVRLVPAALAVGPDGGLRGVWNGPVDADRARVLVAAARGA